MCHALAHVTAIFVTELNTHRTMARELFNRYIWLVDTIYRMKNITFEEINERWKNTEMSQGEDIPLRTFHNHRKAIEEMFDINIECDKRNGYKYYIENADDIEKGGVRSWLLNTFAVNNLINESHHLKRRILFEEIPSGREYLTSLIEAMRDNYAIEIKYQSFEKDHSSTFTLEPYCVKVFRQRWYLVGYCPNYEEIRTYSLDRVRNLSIIDEKFILPSDFDAKEYFESAFGIISNDSIQVEKVVLKALGSMPKYLRALPLHSSQKETVIDEETSIFEYMVKPTFDFKQEILSFGDDLIVEEPKWFRDEVKEIIDSMDNNYE